MSNLRPTLWRTCRAIANPTRLQLLRKLLASGKMPVCELAAETGLSEQSASAHLRTLSSRGLITAAQQSRWVYYSAEANESVDNATRLLEILKKCFQNSMADEEILRLATAFTHARRITIIACLNERPMSFTELIKATAISGEALYRHLKKLEKRNMIGLRNDRYEVLPQMNMLATVLVQMAAQSRNAV